jgi:hypothetical protein
MRKTFTPSLARKRVVVTVEKRYVAEVMDVRDVMQVAWRQHDHNSAVDFGWYVRQQRARIKTEDGCWEKALRISTG